jgi:hypothetical protein
MSKGSKSRRKKERSKQQGTVPPAIIEGETRAPSQEDEFFARGDETGSFPPSSIDTIDVEMDEAIKRRTSPDVVERRARMRRVVAGVISAAALLTVLVGAKALTAHSRRAPLDNSLSVSRPIIPSIAMTAEEAREPVPAAEPTLASPVETTRDPAPSAAEEATAAPASAANPPPTKTDARRLIEHGRMRAGITAARGAMEADPSDAETYLLLGAALQETGQWKEATETFSKCLERATKGPKLECRALRGR